MNKSNSFPFSPSAALRRSAPRRKDITTTICAIFFWSMPAYLSASSEFEPDAFADTAPSPWEDVLDPNEIRPLAVAGPFEFAWSMAFLPDGRLLVTEQAGRLRVVENDQLLADPISGVPEDMVALLDVALDPDFPVNRMLYLSYAGGTKEAATVRIWRAKVEGMNLVDGSMIFETRPAVPGLHQIGGRLAFGPDGFLYLSLGDRTQASRAQDLLDHSGSVLRLHSDGRIPDDNPFVGIDDALPEIFSYGHRNPQGLTADPGGHELWSHEHGPKGGDEINIIRAGENYGWPMTTHGTAYDGRPIGIGSDAPGMMSPLYHWAQSIAPSGMVFYDNDRISAWRGSLLIGALGGEMLVRLELANGSVIREEGLLHEKIGRIRDVRIGPEGLVYVVTDGPEGVLYRLAPALHAFNQEGP